jgi:hypothetical protein
VREVLFLYSYFILVYLSSADLFLVILFLFQLPRVRLSQLKVSKFIEVVRDAILFLLWVLFCLLPYSLGVYVLFLLATYGFLDEFPIINVDN